MVRGMNFTHHISKGLRGFGGGYSSAITHTMSHELGHGIFGLGHTFSEAYGIENGVTYNLMDLTASDAQTVIRDENGKPLDGKPIIHQGTEVKIVPNVTTTDGTYIQVEVVGSNPKQLHYTAASNLTKIEILEKPEDAGFIFGNSVKLPYSIAPTGETHDLKDEFEIIARCGDYVRIASSSLKESGKNSEGFWINSKNITLTVSEIAEIRAEIAKMPTNTAEEKAAKEQAYLDLQWVVPYHSQRDNNTLDTVRHIITYVYDEKGKEIETKHSNFQTLDGKHSWSYDKCSKKGHANPCPNELKENVKAKIFWTTTNWVQKEKITYHKDAKGVNTDKIKEKEVTMYYKGKPGDIMCNLTSTAMNLTYLGLSKNDFDYTICPECSTRCSSNDQLEDFLDCVRKTKKMKKSRLGYSTWSDLAELFGVSMTTKYSDPQKFNALNNQTFINEINGYLSSGKSIQMSVWPGCKGHIVRLVAISTEGIVVDDPYGDVIRTKTCGKKTPRQTGFMHRQSCNSGGYNKNTNSQSSIVGKHNLWKWDEIKDVTCKGIFIFDK